MTEPDASGHLYVARTQAILGVDPGLSGAMVVYNPATKTVISSHIIPTLVVRRNNKNKQTIDIPNLVLATRQLHTHNPNLIAFLELVGANPMHGRRQGTSSMFSFGNTNGAIETAIIAAGIPLSKVTPAVWKRALNCSKDKDVALERASELIPLGVSHWTPKRLVRTKEACKGIAEAAMIAYWGAHFGMTSTFTMPLALAA